MRKSLFCLTMMIGLVSTPGHAEPCVGHGEMVKCGPEKYPVCTDGTTDRKYTCTRGKIRTKRIGFEKRPDKGQILTPGETPPDTTLKESYRDLKN